MVSEFVEGGCFWDSGSFDPFLVVVVVVGGAKIFG